MEGIMLKAIDTHYNGRLFRSRLEARWAVFMDTLGIKYDYEAEGYELGEGLRYLPDFWLPTQNLYLEIKPEHPNDLEMRKAFKLAEASGKNVVILYGQPKAIDLDYTEWEATFNYNGIAFLANIDTNFSGMWLERYHSEALANFLRFRGYEAPDGDGTMQTFRQLIEIDKRYYLDRYGKEHPNWKYGPVTKGLAWCLIPYDGYFLRNPVTGFDRMFHYQALIDAYQAAMTARFEDKR